MISDSFSVNKLNLTEGETGLNRFAFKQNVTQFVFIEEGRTQEQEETVPHFS